jgi:hypothetical protein
MALTMGADFLARQIASESAKIAAKGAFGGLPSSAAAQLQDVEVIKLILQDKSIMTPLVDAFIEKVRQGRVS